MQIQFKRLVFFTVILNFICFQRAFAAPKEDYDPYNGIMKDLKELFPWLEIGLEFRFRVVYDDARKLDREAVGHDRLNTRYRGRLQVKIKQSENVDYNIRIVSEPRYYHRPPSMDKQLIYHEGLVDRLNVTWRNVFDQPVAAVIGRQDIKLGGGWLVIDGTPLDGGRTAYFDALRLTSELNDPNTTADLIWVENYADTAKRLKPINDRDFDLCEQDEQGVIVYLSNKTAEYSSVDGYFIYKHDHDRKTASGYQGEIYTLGALIGKMLNDHWHFYLEFAPQFGHKDGKELSAFGSNSQLTYHFNDDDKNQLYVGYEYLSGDDDPDKNFDRLWGRVDTWSVLYQGTIDSIDGRAYDDSNLHRIHCGWITEPTDKVELKAHYHLLFADENTMAGGTGGLSKRGIFRGQLVRAQIKYKVNEYISHRVEGELFFPGNFYNRDRNDTAAFLRYGLVIAR